MVKTPSVERETATFRSEGRSGSMKRRCVRCSQCLMLRCAGESQRRRQRVDFNHEVDRGETPELLLGAPHGRTPERRRPAVDSGTCQR
jgi:hypothetical protein